MKRLLVPMLLVFAGCPQHPAVLQMEPPVFPACPSGAPPIDVAMFHGDRARSGWNPVETTLTPARVASAGFDWLWDSQPLDSAPAAPRIHGSPLYFDSVGAQPFVVIATSNAWVYAIRACGDQAGSALWKTRLGTPRLIPDLDGGLPLGVLSTPVADLTASPPRLYVTSVDASAGWQLFALDLASGAVLPGWPLTLDPQAIVADDSNGVGIFEGPTQMSQRGALALSLTGDRVYIPFGTFSDSGPGWMVAVDTATARIVASFATSRSTAIDANGGMWGSGGPAIDGAGNLWDTSGNSAAGPIAGTWGESLMSWSPSLQLSGTYTPWNHCQLDRADIDVGGDTPVILPDLDPATTATPHLTAFGSKQGNVYLVDRDHLPGRLDMRPPCSTDPTSDGSLLPPGAQPQFGARGPLNVFGPYSEKYGNVDYAKMRTTLALFQDGNGVALFAAGASKAAVNSMQSVPPGVARLRVVTAAGQPAYLAIEATDAVLAFANPGAPLVTSDGAAGPIVWVLDQNASRLAKTLDTPPKPILYAVDGQSLRLLWKSQPERIGLGGKYASPTVAHGWVFVATDRLQAFGMRR
jgi:hypothetical protein